MTRLPRCFRLSLQSKACKNNAVTLDATLLAILACPQDKGPLYFVETESVLYNPRLKRSYAVRDGIPVMLIDESTQCSIEEAQRIEALIASLGIKPTFAE